MAVNPYISSKRYETFSYLPAFTPEQVRNQIAYAIAQGWNPAVEYVHPDEFSDHYWHMWGLPMFGEDSVDVVLAEIDACHRAFPNYVVRFVAYDNYTQSQGTAFVVHRG